LVYFPSFGILYQEKSASCSRTQCITGRHQGCQMVYFKQKIPIWVNFNIYYIKCWYKLCPFGIYFAYLVCFVVIGYFCGNFTPVWYIVTRKIWHPWSATVCIAWIFLVPYGVFSRKTKIRLDDKFCLVRPNFHVAWKSTSLIFEHVFSWRPQCPLAFCRLWNQFFRLFKGYFGLIYNCSCTRHYLVYFSILIYLVF
jgi:hypothetical protein